MSRPVYLLALSFLLSGCEVYAGVFNPQSPGAARVLSLWWSLFLLGVAVFVPLMALLGWALWRPRARAASAEPWILTLEEARTDRRLLIGGAVLLPLVVLSAVFLLTIRDTAALSEAGTAPVVTVEVTGHQWWWEVRYPDSQITTANEVHIPEGSRVRFNVSAVDVIHSFWVPELHGKIDMLPGITNTFSFVSGPPGEYRGFCAEFCGIQHALMKFHVIVESQAAFTAWLERERQPAAAPAAPLLRRGLQVFTQAKCAECHTVRGTDILSNQIPLASSGRGPDLTHFASRRSIAAGTLPNNRGNLAGWILDPQSIKWSSQMPPSDLSGEDLQALLAYMESLK